MMIRLLKTHLWVFILVIGGLVLVMQNHRIQKLESQLPEESAHEKPQPSSRSSRQSFDDQSSFIQRWQGMNKAERDVSYDKLVTEVSSLTGSELANLISDPRLASDEPLQGLRRFLVLLHRALDPLGALELEQSEISDLSEPSPADMDRLSKMWELFRLLAEDSPESAERWLAQIDLGKHQESFPFEQQLRLVQFLDGPGANIEEISIHFPRDVPVFPPEKLEGLLMALDSIEDQKIRSSAITSLLVSSAIEDPILARNRAEALSLAAAELEETFNQLAEYLEMGSPELLEWTLTFPHESFQGNQDQLFSNYARRDPEGAVEWLENLEAPAETMDIFFSRYAALLSRTSPAEAMNWAERIISPELRERGQRSIRLEAEVIGNDFSGGVGGK